MDIEKLIEETLVSHEHVAPDTDEVADRVLAATRQRIDRRRVLSRPLAVAAGVVVLTLAAVTVVVLNRSGSTPADNTAAPPPDKLTVGQTTPESPIKDLAMPYSLDWLPPGDVEYLARRVNTGATAEEPDKPLFGGEYMLSITKDGQVMDVDVQQMKMSDPSDAAFKSGPGSPVTVGGRQGVESSVSDGPGGYELYLSDGNGGSLYVNVSASLQDQSTLPAQQLVETGRRIAENVRVPGNSTVTPAFGLGELPVNLKICAFDVERGFRTSADGEAGPNTSYELGTCDVMPTVHVNIRDQEPEGTAGRPVLGHETRVLDEGNYRTLFVLDAVDGESVAVAGKLPVEDLYVIANRLILP